MNIQSAKKAKEFAVAISHNDNGQVTGVRVPGHEGRKYEVTLSRNGGLKVSCKQIGSMQTPKTKFKSWDCQGNSRALCYHAIAAVEVAAEKAGCTVHGWACTVEKAKNLTNLYEGSVVVTVTSGQSGIRKYLVCTPASKPDIYETAKTIVETETQWHSGQTRSGDGFSISEYGRDGGGLLMLKVGDKDIQCGHLSSIGWRWVWTLTRSEFEIWQKGDAKAQLKRGRELLRGSNQDREGI